MEGGPERARAIGLGRSFGAVKRRKLKGNRNEARVVWVILAQLDKKKSQQRKRSSAIELKRSSRGIQNIQYSSRKTNVCTYPHALP